MRFETGPGGAPQKTVAELLAMYGDSSAGGRRRRRREAEDVVDPVVPEQGHAVSGVLPPTGIPREQPPAVRVVPQAQASGYGAAPPLTPPPRNRPPQPPLPQSHPTPQGDGGGRYAAPRREFPTDQLPRYPEPAGDLDRPTSSRSSDGAGQGSGNGNGRRGVTGLDPGPSTDPRAPAYAGAATRAVSADELDDDEHYSYLDEPDDDADASTPRVWAAMVAQWIAGAIGGAVLWVVFRYLWQALPVVAIAAALLTTAGLVLLVRAIRRSEDWQTTVLAVLVGLVVTVSPALLWLFGP